MKLSKFIIQVAHCDEKVAENTEKIIEISNNVGFYYGNILHPLNLIHDILINYYNLEISLSGIPKSIDEKLRFFLFNLNVNDIYKYIEKYLNPHTKSLKKLLIKIIEEEY